MKGQIQFTQTMGDGTASTYRHIEADLEIRDKQGELYYFDFLSEKSITLRFTISKMTIDCNFLQIEGANKDGYGKVDFLMATNGFWDVKIKENELRRSFAMSEKLFRSRFNLHPAEVIKFDKIAREILKDAKCQI